jgi:K+ transporter
LTSFKKKFMNTLHKDLHTKWTLGGLLISLGIIYGDIGTPIVCNESHIR